MTSNLPTDEKSLIKLLKTGESASYTFRRNFVNLPPDERIVFEADDVHGVEVESFKIDGEEVIVHSRILHEHPLFDSMTLNLSKVCASNEVRIKIKNYGKCDVKCLVIAKWLLNPEYVKRGF